MLIPFPFNNFYPRRMRLYRRLYGIYTVGFLILIFSCTTVNLFLSFFKSAIKRLYARCQTLVMLIRSTAHPSYCPSAILHIRPTATSDLRQLFIFVLFNGQVRLRQFLGRALRLVRARGPANAARSPSSSCKTTCQQVGWAVGRMGVGPKMHHP